MKRLIVPLLLILAAAARPQDAPAPEDSPLSPLAPLVGGVWTASVPVPAGKPPMRIEARFEWSVNRSAIRFDSVFVSEGRRAPYSSGLYAWNAASRRIEVVYTDADGSLTKGSIRQEDGVLVNDLVETAPDGKETPIRVRLTRIGDNLFENAIFVPKDGRWAPLVTVTYRRAPPT
jgi:hypothetical protein